MRPLCPNCGETESQHVDRRRESESESAVTVEFSCRECGHGWTVSL